MSSKSWLIFGLGVTGQAALDYCLNHGIPVIAYDDQEKKELLDTYELPFYFKEFPLHLIPSLSQVIFSPGIPGTHPLLQKLIAHQIPVLSDIEYFATQCPGKIIGITGSNGKSTVTALTTHLLHHLGFKAIACGNFGYPVMKLLSEPAYDYYLVELSSYQLEWTEHLNAEVGCLLNITPNHLDRYKTLPAYQEAKERLFHQCKQLILHESISPLRATPNQTFYFSEQLSSLAYFHVKLQGNRIHFYAGQTDLGAAPHPNSSTSHHDANQLAALAIIQCLGLSAQAAVQALSTYLGLPHRLQKIPTQDGLIWINDSKSTTTTATIAAVKTTTQNYPDHALILILGGIFKEYDLSLLLTTLQASPLKALIIYGRDQAIFVQAFQPHLPCHTVTSLEQAVTLAKSLAKAQDCILLSPACSSWDQFPNFEVRGERFKEYIAQA